MSAAVVVVLELWLGPFFLGFGMYFRGLGGTGGGIALSCSKSRTMDEYVEMPSPILSGGGTLELEPDRCRSLGEDPQSLVVEAAFLRFGLEWD